MSEYEYDRVLFHFRIFELSVMVLLMVSHTKTEFIVPSLGYGEQWEIASSMTVFSAMLIPTTLRLQAGVVGPGLQKTVEMVLLFTGAVLYIFGSAVTIHGWIRTQKVRAVIFRKYFTEYLLGKGIICLVLAATFCIDAYFVVAADLFR